MLEIGERILLLGVITCVTAIGAATGALLALITDNAILIPAVVGGASAFIGLLIYRAYKRQVHCRKNQSSLLSKHRDYIYP